MEAISYIHVLRGAAGLAGLNMDEVLAADARRWRDWISAELETAWTSEQWPDLMRTEERTPVSKVISMEQAGETLIGTPFAVLDDDPLVSTRAEALAWTLTHAGILIYSNLTAVWVHFRLRAPLLIGEVYDTDATYTTGEQVYFSGDFYTALEAIALAESPASDPGKWALIEIPRLFARYLMHAAYVRHLRGDGQLDKAAAEGRAAWAELERAADQLYRQSGQTRRVQVTTR